MASELESLPVEFMQISNIHDAFFSDAWVFQELIHVYLE